MASKSNILEKIKEKKEAEKKTIVKIDTAEKREKVKISNVVDKRDSEKKLDREEILKKIGKSSKKPTVLVVDPEKLKIPVKESKLEEKIKIKSEAGPSGIVKEVVKSKDGDSIKESEVKVEIESEKPKTEKKLSGIQILPPSSLKLTSGLQILPKVTKSKSGEKAKGVASEKSETVVLKPTTKIEHLSDDEYAQLITKLPPKMDEISNIASEYYLNNREIFVNSVNKLLAPYEADIKKASTNYDCKNTSKEFELLTHQKIVRDYINIYTPYRGLLVFHGLGSGKTCSSIAIAEGIKENKEIIVMLPASLETNYKEELKKCGDTLYKKNQYWEFISITDKEKMKLIKPISEILKIPKEIIIKNKGAWFVDASKTSNYDELSAEDKTKLERQLNAMIEVKYKFIRYNGLTYNNWRRLTNNNSINPFDNKVVIIDEAHNLISRIVNKMQIKKDTLPMMIFRALSSAENCKIIMLTGTPIINYPNEIGIMLSILRGNIKTYEFNLKKKSGEALTEALLIKILTENSKSNHMLDYIQIKITETKNLLKITRNPYGFWSVKNGQRYKGVKLDPQGNETEVEFLETIKSILNKNKIEIIGAVEEESNTALPLEADEFNGKFIKNMDIGKPEVQNMNLLKKRILGLVSYFPDIEALLPKFEKDNVDFFKIVEIEMSDYQFDLYDNIRVDERKDELRSAMSRSKKKNGDELYNIPVSTYRVFSRAFCNFVFPPGEFKRPMPNDGDSTEIQSKDFNEDLLDGLTEEETILEEEIDASSDIDDLASEADYDEKKSKTKAYQDKVNKVLVNLNRNKESLFTPSELKIYSPKFLKILENLQSKENIGLNLIYSQFRTLEGIGIFSLVLEANGFAEFKLKKEGGLWNIDVSKEDLKKPKFVLYTGKETVEEKELIRKIFNGQWELLPIELTRQVIDMANQSERIPGKTYDPIDKNKFGDVIKSIMITASGAEGISLSNVRYVHIMEPYWHPVRIDQVIGRARRICSHKDFDEPKFQTVEVFLYLMTLSKKQEESATIEMRNKDLSKLIPGKIYTSDQALYEISLIKEEVNKDLLHNLKEASIDCIFHKRNAKGKEIKCFGFGSQVNPDKFSYLPNINSEEKDSVASQNVVKKIMSAKPVKINGVEYMIGLDNVKLENVNDDGTLEAKLFSKASFVEGIPTQVGSIIYKVSEKDGIKELKPTKEYYLASDSRGKV